MAADLWEPFGSSHSKCLEETPQTTIRVADQSDSLQQAAPAYLGAFLCGFFSSVWFLRTRYLQWYKQVRAERCSVTLFVPMLFVVGWMLGGIALHHT